MAWYASSATMACGLASRAWRVAGSKVARKASTAAFTGASVVVCWVLLAFWGDTSCRARGRQGSTQWGSHAAGGEVMR